VLKLSIFRRRGEDSRGRWAAALQGAAAGLLLCLTAGAQVTPTSPSSTPAVNPAAPGSVPQAGQAVAPAPPPGSKGATESGQLIGVRPALSTSVWQQEGTLVTAIQFEGVPFAADDGLLSQLSQKAGTPLDPEKVRNDLHRLFASGRYRDISVRGEKSGAGIALVYAGVPRYYIGRVQIDGVHSERLASLLEFSTKLEPGTAYTETQVPAAIDAVKLALAQNGYYQPVLNVTTAKDDQGQQVNFTFKIDIGVQARVGEVAVTGKDPGFTPLDFRSKAKLNCGVLEKIFSRHCVPKVTRNTTSTALASLRTQYQKKDRLEAAVSVQKQTYSVPRKQLDYDFNAEQGPLVKIVVVGAKFSKSRLHLLVPVFEEGAVDNDLLNEGVHNIRDYLQQQGYFDVTDKVEQLGEGTGNVTVQYTVNKGVKHKVLSVEVVGNKYFDRDTILERLRIKKADLYQRAGRYSQALLTADTNSITALYRANGFNGAKVTSTVKDIDQGASGKDLKVAQIAVTFKVEEGTQQKFGKVTLAGVDPSRTDALKDLVQAEEDQPFSLLTLSGDRDAVLTYYVSHGFDQAKIEIKQDVQPADKSRTDVTLTVSEGQQVFIDKVLTSGVERTRMALVQSQFKVHPGDPLDQSALLETQRNLYNLALFNEVNAAVQNPTGDAPRKNVLVQVTEARRWDVTYGFGMEAQTGTPAVIPGNRKGNTAAQNGKAGVSPRVSGDVSRINLRGTDQSLTLHTTYGLLERVATLTFTNPHLRGEKNFAMSVSGGYSNVQDISTFASSTLQGDVRVTQKIPKTDTVIYDFQYRRVSVDPNSLEVSPNLIPLLSEPVRVGGPGITWFHDTRDPSPLDAGRGKYISIQNFLASSAFGSQADFDRMDVSQSTYYTFGKRKYVFARNTRIGAEKAFGANSNAGNATTPAPFNCSGVFLNTNASCNAVPLPERLYAGGATSHRGFPINGAGPRDLSTGYPVGGSGVVVNTLELRLPPPTLPLVGDSVSFVLFHDMGNVFQHPGDMFKSVKNFKQPNEQTCSDLTIPPGTPGATLSEQQQNAVGTCDFRYYSHAVGLGARYKTPVGPIRADFSYNLNPPVYPVFTDFNNTSPYVGHGSHFNFFFSIGQSF
jgi:outer membrane protein insertion porin family